MFSFENTVVIDRPIEYVFAFVTDLQRIPMWNYYVQSVTPTSVEVGTQGATYPRTTSKICALHTSRLVRPWS